MIFPPVCLFLHSSWSMIPETRLVSKNTVGSGQDNVTKLSGRQNLAGPFFQILQSDIKSWGNDSAFVKSTQQLDDDLIASMVINELEFSNVSISLHESQEFDDDF